MAENGSDFIVDDGIGGKLEAWLNPAAAAEDAFLEKAIEVLSYAQDNAPWADRTGAARSGLDVEVYRTGDSVVLELFHTVDYGLFLETIQNGEFATIMPTLELYAQEVFEAAGGRITSMDGGEV